MSSASDFIIENGVLKKYVGPGGDVVIPEDVTKIGYSAFSHLEDLHSVTIFNGVIEIGEYAFDFCKKLKKITFSENIPNIGECAFRGCEELTDSQGMVIIGNILHYVAPWVTELTVPEEVIEIKDRAFEACHRNICSISLPPSMKVLGNCFRGFFPSLTAIELPENLVQICDMAFAGCRALKSIVIPDGVIKIGRYTFKDCSSLESISLPQNLREIGVGAFCECQSLTEISIPDTVESIGEEAFKCTQNAVGEILSDGEFLYMPGGLRHMQVSEETIKKLGESSARLVLIQPGMMIAYLLGDFHPNNQLLEKLLISAINLKKNKEFCVEVLIKADAANATDKLFQTLKKVTLGDIDVIEKRCNDEKKLQLKAFLLQYKKEMFSEKQLLAAEEDNVKKDLGLREKTLAEWRKEFTIKIADHTAVISKYKGNDETVSIPAYVGGHPVVALGDKAFTHCETVRTVYIPDGVKWLGWRLFWGCPNVKDIHIPASVDSIGAQAIQGKKRCIHAPAGSCAETYAKENNIPFVAE